MTSFHLSFAHALQCDDVECVALSRASLQIDDEIFAAMQRSSEALQTIIMRGDAVYGLTTGFGPLVRYDGTRNDAQGIGLIAHLGAGYGENIEAEVVRGAMLIRLHTLARGMSGIAPQAARFYADMLNKNIIAAVPSIGSLGASGDLIPLAHVVRAMIGEGEVLHGTGTIPALQALQESGLQPCVLTGRDALALVNGTSFSSAYMALALVRSRNLIAKAEECAGWLMRVMGCRRNGSDERLHRAKGHKGQEESARNILREATINGDSEDPNRPLQEIYSIRCAPQILGAARDVLRQSKEMTEQEINGVDDNPLVDVEALEILHGGNFMTQHIAFAADSLNSALTQAGNLAERHIEALVNPALNGGAPLLLASKAGAMSGMAGVQLTATALLAEMRSHRQQYASSSLPTNVGNQDIVPMGFQAARECYHQTERLAAILACEALCIAQLAALKGYAGALPTWMQDFEPLREDRAMRGEIESLAEKILRGV
jgi:tyrosine ammonia-lyase